MNKRKTLLYSIGPLCNGVLGVITIPLLAWIYSPEDLGRLAILQIFCSFIIALFSFGLDQSYIRFFHDSENKKELLKMTLIPCSATFLMLFLIFIIIQPSFFSEKIFNLKNFNVNFILLFIGFFSLLLRFFSLVLRMSENALLFSFNQLFPKVIFIILVFIFMFFKENNLLNIYFISILISTLVTCFFVKKDVSFNFFGGFNVYEFKGLFIYGLPLMLGSIAYWGMNAIDRLFIKKYLSLNDLGVYSVALSVVSGVVLFSSIINTVWAPQIFKWESQKTIEIDKIKLVINIILMFVYVVVVVFVLFSWVLNFILPEKYYLVQFLVLVGVLCPLFYTLSEVTGVGLMLSKKTLHSMSISFFSFILNVILNYFFIQYYGLKGACIAMALSFFTFMTLRTEFSGKFWVKSTFRHFYSINLFLLFVAICILIFEPSIFERLFIGFLLIVLGFFYFKPILKYFFLKIGFIGRR